MSQVFNNSAQTIKSVGGNSNDAASNLEKDLKTQEHVGASAGSVSLIELEKKKDHLDQLEVSLEKQIKTSQDDAQKSIALQALKKVKEARASIDVDTDVQANIGAYQEVAKPKKIAAPIKAGEVISDAEAGTIAATKAIPTHAVTQVFASYHGGKEPSVIGHTKNAKAGLFALLDSKDSDTELA